MKLQLTISLLVSDRMDTLKKCLDSVSPLLRELDSELIIVFTGKEPAVLEIARQYTSHIILFTWCNDFAKARNAGLREASGEWFLYLDDDEWFEDTTEIIQFFKSGEYRNYQTAMYIQRNYNDLEGKTYNDAPVGRMCRLTPDIKFVSPIHEGLYPFSDPRKDFQCYVHHFGYVRKGALSDIKEKSERNTSLLLKLYEENPTAHNCMQLAQEYRYIDDEATAIKYCREGLKLAAKEKRIYTYELWMQVHLPLMLSVVGNREEALKEGERILLSPRLLEVGQAHLHSILATLCWDLKEYKKGIRHVRSLRKVMLYLEKHPEKAARQSGASITYTTAKEHAVPAYIAGLLFAAEAKDAGQFQEILGWIPWEEERLVQDHYENLEQMKALYPEQREVMLEGYFHLQAENSYVSLQKALYAEEKRTSAEAEELWKSCAGDCPSGFMDQLVELAMRNGFSLNPLLEHISIETWDEYTRMLTEKLIVSDMPEFLQKLSLTLEDYPVCVRRLEQNFLKKQLLGSSQEPEELVELLRQYCKSVHEEAEALYRKEIVCEPECFALPCQFKFGLFMEKALEYFESGNYAECIPLIKKAVRAYPQMSVVAGRLSEYLEEKMKEPQQPVSEEFAALGRQVKQMLLGFMENGQWREAYGVAEQLTALLPGDLEVLKLKQEIMKHM